MIISINLTAANAAWLKGFNTALEKAIGAKIGISMIINILINQARGAEIGLRHAIILDKHAALKRKAMDAYSKKILAIGKKKAG